MPEISGGLILVVLLILCAEFVNGWTDAPNAIATVISTRVLKPIPAVIMASLLNLAGVLLAGTAVATTIGKGIVNPELVDLTTIGAAKSDLSSGGCRLAQPLSWPSATGPMMARSSSEFLHWR